MAFKVSYRGNDGAQESIIIDAASRPQLFAELEKRGISAIRVEETTGKPKKARPSTPSARKPSPLRGLLAGLLVISLAVAAWFYLLPTLEHVKAKKDKKPALIAEVQSAVLDPQAANEEIDGDPTPLAQFGQNVWTTMTVQDVTNKTHLVIDQRDPDDPTDLGGTDQLLSMIFSTPLGVDPVPIPFSFDEDGGVDDFIQTITNRVEITEKDDAAKADRKMDIIESKLEILELIGEGYTPETILKDAYQLRVQAANVRNDMIDEIKKWILEDNPPESTVDVAVQQFNQRLEAEGILTISSDYLEFDESEIEGTHL